MATNQYGQTFSGNDDFRGYLAANGGEGYLDFTGNDGNVDLNKVAENYAASGIRSRDLAQRTNATLGDVRGLYDQWSAARVDPLDTNNNVDPYAAQRAAQKSQLQGQLGQLDRQQDIGLGNITNSFQRSANRLNEQNAIAQRNYDTQAQQNSRGYLNTRNGIQQNTRATANSLQRLLGMNGAGNSSAAYEAAPYAAGLQGTQNLSQAQQNYGNNAAALDTQWGDTQRSYRNSVEDLDTQKYQQENGLRSSIAQTRASLLDRIQQADGTNQYQTQINDLLSKITGFGQQYANPVLKAADLQFNAPDMGQYTLDRFGGRGAPQAGGAQSDLSPSFLNLLTGNQERDEYGNLI